MTAGEFVELMNSTLKENEKFVIKELPRFLKVHELAELTGYSVATIHCQNWKRKIPGSMKVEGRIMFDTEKVLEWIESQSIHRPTRNEQIENLEKNFSKGKMRNINC